MDISEILSSVEHNPRYLVRYIKFIRNYSSQELIGYKERHHICPSSMFKEFANLKTNPWNCIQLTARQHFVAHHLLWKTFRNSSQSCAFWQMSNKNKNRISSKQYQTLKEENNKYISSKRKGKTYFKNTAGEIFYCSKEDERVQSGELVGLTRGNKRPEIKTETSKKLSIAGKNKSSYRNKMGDIIKCEKTDPRVISGEYVSIHKGSKHKKRTESFIKNHQEAASKRKGSKAFYDKQGKKFFLFPDDPRIKELQLV